jgi:flagellar hook protein FlgE
MSIFGALLSGVSGLTAESQALSMISDNIANSNTTAYKATDASFQTLVTQSAQAGVNTAGGVVAYPSATVNQQGLLQAASSNTDLAISGGGFFVVSNQATTGNSSAFSFTRDGSFSVNANGYLVNGDGFFLQGQPLTSAEAAQVLAGNDNVLTATSLDTLQTININGLSGSAVATSQVTLAAELPNNAKPTSTANTITVPVFDSQGGEHDMTLSFSVAPTETFTVSGTIKSGDTLSLKLNGVATAITVGPLGTNPSMTDVATAINSALSAQNISGVSASAVNGTSVELTDSSGNGYLNNHTNTTLSDTTTPGTTFTPTVTQSFTIPSGDTLAAGNKFTLSLNGTNYTTAALGSNPTASTLATALNAAGLPAGVTATADGNSIVITDISGSGNLDGATAASLAATTATPTYTLTAGTLGAPAPNTWNVTASIVGGTVSFNGGNQVEFNADGSFNSGFSGMSVNWSSTGPSIPTSPQALTFNLGTTGKNNGLTQTGSQFSATEVNQNGLAFGAFTGLAIDQHGIVTANFDNGLKQPIFIIPIATFNNPNGLAAQSGNGYTQTNVSGSYLLQQAGTGAAGQVAPSELESSNVDIASEFSNLIITQQAYAANSKVITTANQMITTLLQATQ